MYMDPRTSTAALALAVGLLACEKHASQPAPLPTDALHATTRAGNVTVFEEVRLDAAGHLLHADTVVRDDGGSPEVHVVADPPTHRVVVERGGRRVEITIAGDEPWILAPPNDPKGDPIATKLLAYTTYRAAQSSEWLRLVRPLDQTSYLVPRDQYVIGHTVIVGEQAIDIDEQPGG
jgi:hypothetical protein